MSATRYTVDHSHHVDSTATVLEYHDPELAPPRDTASVRNRLVDETGLIRRIQLTSLELQVAVLEIELAAHQQQNQALIEQYEYLLGEQTQYAGTEHRSLEGSESNADEKNKTDEPDRTSSTNETPKGVLHQLRRFISSTLSL